MVYTICAEQDTLRRDAAPAMARGCREPVWNQERQFFAVQNMDCYVSSCTWWLLTAMPALLADTRM